MRKAFKPKQKRRLKSSEKVELYSNPKYFESESIEVLSRKIEKYITLLSRKRSEDENKQIEQIMYGVVNEQVEDMRKVVGSLEEHKTKGHIVSAIGKEYRDYFSTESMKHPGKMFTSLCEMLVNECSELNESVFDPMAGIGTTLIVGALLERNTIGLELNPNYYCNIIESLNRLTPKVRKRITPIQGNAYNTKELLDINGVEQYDSVITSPPYPKVLKARKVGKKSPKQFQDYAGGYGNIEGNMGEFSAPELIEALHKVYSQVLEKLKPGGKMAVVVKKGTTKHKPVNFDLMIKALFNLLKLVNIKEWRFKIPRYPESYNLFWNKQQGRMTPEVFDALQKYEYVVVGQKKK